MSTKHTRRTRANRKQAGRKKLTKTRARARNSLPKTIPTRVDRLFQFVDRVTLSGAAPAVSQHYVSNSVWRPKATSGSAATPFAEMQGQYALYRVIAYQYKIVFTNLEAFPVAVYCVNTNEDPVSFVSLEQSAVNDLSQYFILSAKGGQDRWTVTRRYTVQRIVGSGGVVKNDDDYRGTMTSGSESNPADVTWLGVAANSMSGSNLTNGVSVMVHLSYKTMLYGRQITTLGDQPGPIMVNGKIKGGEGPLQAIVKT